MTSKANVRGFNPLNITERVNKMANFCKFSTKQCCLSINTKESVFTTSLKNTFFCFKLCVCA